VGVEVVRMPPSVPMPCFVPGRPPLRRRDRDLPAGRAAA